MTVDAGYPYAESVEGFYGPHGLCIAGPTRNKDGGECMAPF